VFKLVRNSEIWLLDRVLMHVTSPIYKLERGKKGVGGHREREVAMKKKRGQTISSSGIFTPATQKKSLKVHLFSQNLWCLVEFYLRSDLMHFHDNGSMVLPYCNTRSSFSYQ